MWREAYSLARGEFEQARTGWQAKLQQSEAERNSMAEDVEQLEAQRDEALRAAVTTREQAAAAATAAAADLADQRSRADKAEASIETMTDERRRLIAERDRQQADLEKGRTASEAARQETAAVARSSEAEARRARVAAEARASELSTELTETAASRENAQPVADRYQAEAAEAAMRAQAARAETAKAVQELNKEQGRPEHAEAEAQRLREGLAATQEHIRSLEGAKQPKK